MTGEQLLPVVAILVGVLALNLGVAWLLVRRRHDPEDLFGSVAAGPSTADRDGPESGERATDRGAISNETEAGAGGREDPPPLDADDETVICRHCGAENRPGYRYCRWCVRSGFVERDADVTAGAAMTDRSL